MGKLKLPRPVMVRPAWLVSVRRVCKAGWYQVSGGGGGYGPPIPDRRPGGGIGDARALETTKTRNINSDPPLTHPPIQAGLYLINDHPPLAYPPIQAGLYLTNHHPP